MSPREKILAIAVGLAATIFVLYMAVNRLVLSKLDDLRDQEIILSSDVAMNEAKRDEYERQASRLPTVLARTFGSEENVVSERVRARLTKLLEACDLPIQLTPQGGTKVQGKYKEISWQVSIPQGKGKIDQIMNFLFLLDSEPYLHRVEGLTLNPKHRSGTIEMKLRFVTIVPARRGAEDIPPGQAAEDPFDVKILATPQRKQYDIIASRDPFRPYRKRPEPEPEPKPAGPETVVKPPPPAGQRIVSLANWAGQPEVHVRDLKTGKTDVLKPGQDLAGGTIVMIDYRRMPMPDSPEVLSASRVIIQKGQDYWAVELGQETAKSRKLDGDNLPEELSSR